MLSNEMRLALRTIAPSAVAIVRRAAPFVFPMFVVYAALQRRNFLVGGAFGELRGAGVSFGQAASLAERHGNVATALALALAAVLWVVLLRKWRPRNKWMAGIRFTCYAVVTLSIYHDFGNLISRRALGIPEPKFQVTILGVSLIWFVASLVLFPTGVALHKRRPSTEEDNHRDGDTSLPTRVADVSHDSEEKADPAVSESPRNSVTGALKQKVINRVRLAYRTLSLVAIFPMILSMAEKQAWRTGREPLRIRVINDSASDAIERAIQQPVPKRQVRSRILPPDYDPTEDLDPRSAERRVRLRQATVINDSASSERAAKTLKLSRETGLPREVVAGNYDEIERLAQQKDFDPVAYARTSPAVTAWIAKHPPPPPTWRDDLVDLADLAAGVGPVPAVFVFALTAIVWFATGRIEGAITLVNRYSPAHRGWRRLGILVGLAGALSIASVGMFWFANVSFAVQPWWENRWLEAIRPFYPMIGVYFVLLPLFPGWIAARLSWSGLVWVGGWIFEGFARGKE